MDPLSITSASVGLAAAVYKCAIEVKKIIGTIADAVDSLSDLAEEAQLIQGAFQGVEDALKDNQEAISRYKVEEVFSIAVKGCRATLACIKQEFELLFNRSDWKARFMVLWKEDDMKRLLGRLDRKRESILLLLQLLSLSSVREVQALVTKKQSALTVAKEDITALIPTYWSCRDTILDSLDKETVESIYADWDNRESKLSATEFDFDYELINTRTYRQALAQAQAKSDRELPPRKKLDNPARELNGETIEPVEDLIDLSCEPSRETVSVLPRIPPQSYTDLAGLQFMPITVDEEAASAGSPEASETAEPTDMRGMTESSRESDLSLESRDESSQGWRPRISRWSETTANVAPSGTRIYEPPQEEGLTGQPASTISTSRHKATKSQTSLLIEYFENGKWSADLSGNRRPSVRVRLTPSMREGFDTKQHPEVPKASRIHPTPGILSGELLGGNPTGSSMSATIRDNLGRRPIDLEIASRGRRRRRGSPLQKSAESSDETQKGRTITNVPAKNARDSKYQPYEPRYVPDDDIRPRSRNIARRSRTKAKETQRSQRTDSTEANAGSRPKIDNPRRLRTVEDAIRGLILPELDAIKSEAQKSRRGFTDADTSSVHITSALGNGLGGNEKEQDTKDREDNRPSSRRLHRISERERDSLNKEERRKNRS
ncbi:hypothetical protein FGADI_4427 [Fusarium gaditjirri]|uniref:Fungal N-terminal domain-containing protein n=1 Tax=Fusarium gaditjirri TaxID=282569 RepID=A0A8H4WYY5_9HYPO|nr:hypothetical protein FGADI_4427 [Fusarium gaditjirri]